MRKSDYFCLEKQIGNFNIELFWIFQIEILLFHNNMLAHALSIVLNVNLDSP